MDVVVLARIQFAANITFHVLFPSISIALGWVLLFFRLKHLRATDPQQKLDWLRAYRLWTKIFALTFALGVVSGVTMSFQFGTNWPGYMERVGNISDQFGSDSRWQALAREQVGQRDTVDELADQIGHAALLANLEDRDNRRMPQLSDAASFAQKALSRGIAFEVRGIDDLQGNGKAKIGVESLEGDTHCSAAQLPKAAILSPEYFVLMISIGCRHCVQQ